MTDSDTNAKKHSDSGSVQAYAKLESQNYSYYIRTLQVTLGRKMLRQDRGAENVDIPLANTKSVSRQHARLFYNFTTQRFELMVIGKNGAFVNDQFIERGVTVPLENRTKIQIGDIAFVFLLPYSDAEDGPVAVPSASINYKAISSMPTPSSTLTASAPEKRKRKVVQERPASDDDEDPDRKSLFSYPGFPNPYMDKDEKPPYSYANLIAQAINASNEKRLTLNEIYTYLLQVYPYFRKVTSTGWQNSVRHNLSLNKAFIKMPRRRNDSGKGAFWSIDPELEHSLYTAGPLAKTRYTKRASTSSAKEEDDSPKSSKKIRRGKKDANHDTTPEQDAQEPTPRHPSHKPSPSEEPADEPAEPAKEPASSSTPLNIPKKPTEKKTPPSSPSPASPSSSPPPDLTSPPAPPPAPTTPSSNVQAQLQLQLQNTIRQHLIDPIRNPLPPTIAQLLPQAIAQLPPQLASQLSQTLHSALRAQQQHEQQLQQKPTTKPIQPSSVSKKKD